MKNIKILEALQMQPLSEEEKSARHILGRLYGPIATSNEGTRNGRKYNKALWEKALNDEIFKEKINTKSLFLELGHPTDREETDMTKVCACIPETPKIVNGDLYAYVDILDTPNGKLLKTFCDYGFVPGISSRGSGDVMENNEVDPETFFLETWDIVQLPAVKDARLAMCEGLDTKTMKLRKALTESYEAASEEDKKVMKETLDNLDIMLEDDDEFEVEVGSSNIVESKEEENVEIEVGDIKDAVKDEEEIEAIDVIKDKLDIHGEGEEVTIAAKGELENEEAPKINVEVSEEEFDALEKEFHDEDGQNSEESGDIEEVESEDETEVEEVNEIASEEEVSEEPVEETEEAEDNGDEEVIESLKEMIRQKDLLENEVKSLRSEKTVSDTEVKELKEELNKYKVAFTRISEVAAKSKLAEKEVKALQEQLNQKDVEIEKLKQDRSVKLQENVAKDNAKIKNLSEQLRSVHKELENKDKQIDEQANTYRAKINESVKIAKIYKAKCESAISKYIDFRASMLGVRPAEITNKLSENYSIDDVEKVCESILTESVSISAINVNKNSKLKLTEQKSFKPSVKDDDGYDDLLELAGLK